MSIIFRDLKTQHESELIGWDPVAYALIEANADQMTWLTHTQDHGTAEGCLEILRDLGVNIDSITPIVTQVGLMKDREGLKQPFVASHPGSVFKDPVRKAIGGAFGTSGKSAKEFSRTPREDLPNLIGLPFGVSSPFINSDKYSNFKWIAVVFDSTDSADTVAIAAGKNSTLLIPRKTYEGIIVELSQVHPELKIVKFPNGIEG